MLKRMKLYENKRFGKFYSTERDELKTDNVLKSLYVSKYTKYYVKQNNAQHMNDTMKKWKSMTKTIKQIEELGEILKMNIQIDGKNLYKKHKKTYINSYNLFN